MGSSPDSQFNKRPLKAFFRGGFKGVVGGFSARPGEALFFYCVLVLNYESDGQLTCRCCASALVTQENLRGCNVA